MLFLLSGFIQGYHPGIDPTFQKVISQPHTETEVTKRGPTVPILLHNLEYFPQDLLTKFGKRARLSKLKAFYYPAINHFVREGIQAWSTEADSRSALAEVRGFKSLPSHLCFVVKALANNASILHTCYLYRDRFFPQNTDSHSRRGIPGLLTLSVVF